eukprot:3606485-Prymnesium_polylepis.1
MRARPPLCTQVTQYFQEPEKGPRWIKFFENVRRRSGVRSGRRVPRRRARSPVCTYVIPRKRRRLRAHSACISLYAWCRASPRRGSADYQGEQDGVYGWHAAADARRLP